MNPLAFKSCFITLLLISFAGFGQEKEDQLASEPEKGIIQIDNTLQTKRKPYLKERNPSLAGLYSAILPGLGQYYNRAVWWKYPLYYTLIGTGIYFIRTEHAQYQNHNNDFIEGLNRGEDESILRRFANLADDAQRDRNLAIVFTGVFYLINIIDAIVDAHLSLLKVDKDFSFYPVFLNDTNFVISPGAMIVFRF